MTESKFINVGDDRFEIKLTMLTFHKLAKVHGVSLADFQSIQDQTELIGQVLHSACLVDADRNGFEWNMEIDVFITKVMDISMAEFLKWSEFIAQAVAPETNDAVNTMASADEGKQLA